MSRFSGSHYNNNSESESGWTGYFEESFEREGRLIRRSEVDYSGGREEEEEEEIDLSMISDASSGPRNVFYEENCQSGSGKRKQYMALPNQYSCLDDTASSSVFGLSKREINPYSKESFVENTKELSQSQSQKPHGKKQTSFFPYSTKELAKN